MKRCSSRLILWQVALIDLGFIEEWSASPATGKNNLLFVTPAKESTFVATHQANEIWQVRSGLESLSQQDFVKPIPSLPTVSQSHQISLLLPTLRFGCAQHWGDARRYHSRSRAVTCPQMEISLYLGTIKRYWKFHFVVTTGYRNRISCIRWSYSEIFRKVSGIWWVSHLYCDKKSLC